MMLRLPRACGGNVDEFCSVTLDENRNSLQHRFRPAWSLLLVRLAFSNSYDEYGRLLKVAAVDDAENNRAIEDWLIQAIPQNRGIEPKRASHLLLPEVLPLDKSR